MIGFVVVAVDANTSASNTCPIPAAMLFGDVTRSASGLCGVAIDVFEEELLIVVAGRGCDPESTFSQALPSSISLARVLLPGDIIPLWVDIDDSSCRFGIKVYAGVCFS
jgi:hypothetical protein